MLTIAISGFAIGAGIASLAGWIAWAVAAREPYRHAAHNANVLAYVEAKRRDPALQPYMADVDYTRPMSKK